MMTVKEQIVDMLCRAAPGENRDLAFLLLWTIANGPAEAANEMLSIETEGKTSREFKEELRGIMAKHGITQRREAVQ